MRIRKNASKLLASIVSPQSTASAPPPAATAASAAAPSANGFSAAAASSPLCTPRLPLLGFCELNRSPWDVIPSSPSEDEYLQRSIPVDEAQNHLLHQEGGDGEDDGPATVGNGSGVLGRKRAPAAASAATTNSPALIVPKNEAMEGGIDKEERREKQRQRQRLLQNNGRKKNISKENSNCRRLQVEEEVSIWDDASTTSIKEGQAPEVEVGEEKGSCATAATCKKSDGKGWHCKREAKHPYTLCGYHLSQIRGYYNLAHPLQPSSKGKRTSTDSLGEGARLDNTNAKKKKKTKKKNPPSNSSSKHRKKKPTTYPEAPEFYYYYSGFGPWRGKRRGGDGDAEHAMEAEDAAFEAVPATPAPPIPATAAEYDDANGLDPESIDDVEDSSEDDMGSSRIKRRKGRKPIKARSLKSLL